MASGKPEDDVSDRTVVRGAPKPPAHEPDASRAPASATVFDPGGSAWSGPASAPETVFQPAVSPETIVSPSIARGASLDKASLAPATVERDAAAGGDLEDDAPAIDGDFRYGAANPMLAAASPLLLLMGRLRLVPTQGGDEALATHIASAIETFELRVTKAAGVSARDANIAKYALCEMADDVVGSLPGHAGWASHSMVARFFGVAATGAGFFQALNQVLADPEAHCDLLELMHACLALGFQGQYRAAGGESGSLARVRADVYDTLRYFRQRPAADVSPHWAAAPSARPRRRRRVPVWGVAAAAVALVTASFFGLRTVVTADAESVASDLLALNPMAAVAIERTDIAPAVEPAKAQAKPAPVVEKPAPQPSPRIERLRGALADDIAAKRLTVGTKGDFVVVELNNQSVFGAGSAKANKDFQPLAARIGAALDAERGPIRVVGHTDNVKPKKSSAFKSNFDLSLARAKAVAALLKLKDAARTSVDGKGGDEPVADNATADGRAKNRRVDIMIAVDGDAAGQPAAAQP